jgi:glycosyltransferase involved in cell wall biosynthesis
MDPDVTVVIAAKNEAPTIRDVVTCCRRFAAQVLVVDGQSRDGTTELASESGAEVLTELGPGKGNAIRTAIPHIRGSITVLIDADGSHVASDIPRLIEPIRKGEADHVSASRLLGGSSELHGGFDEFFRLAGSSFITACINWRFNVRLSDSQNGFRAIRTCVLRDLGLAEAQTTVEQEMVIRTLRRGYRIVERPSHEFARRYGQSHVNVWRAAPRYAWSLLTNLLR